MSKMQIFRPYPRILNNNSWEDPNWWLKISRTFWCSVKFENWVRPNQILFCFFSSDKNLDWDVEESVCWLWGREVEHWLTWGYESAELMSQQKSWVHGVVGSQSQTQRRMATHTFMVGRPACMPAAGRRNTAAQLCAQTSLLSINSQPYCCCSFPLIILSRV